MTDDTERGDTLDALLTRIEFPGEDRQALRTYLEHGGFVDRVMERILAEQDRSRKAVLWAGFAAVNLFLLVLLGANSHLNAGYFAVQQTLSQFFYLFLGLSAIGGIFGLILSIDTEWFTRWTRRRM